MYYETIVVNNEPCEGEASNEFFASFGFATFRRYRVGERVEVTMRKAALVVIAGLCVLSPASGEEYTRAIRFESNPSTNLRHGDEMEWGAVYYKSVHNPKNLAGVWEAGPRHVVHAGTDHYEFMHVLSGSFTLIDNTDKRAEIFKAGDTLLVLRGADYTWDQPSGRVRKFWVVFNGDGASPDVPRLIAASKPTFLRVRPVSAHGDGAGSGSASHIYFNNASATVGYREMSGVSDESERRAGSGAEFMILISGSLELDYQDGTQDHFNAGDALLVPFGVSAHRQRSEARFFYVDLD